MARLIGTTAEHLAFNESGTLAWWRALGSMSLGAGDRVLATQSEYLGTVLPLRQRGIDIEVLPDDAEGSLDLTATARALRAGPRAIVVCHAASHVGVVNDVEAVGALVAELSPDTWFVVDACQSVGQMPVDVQAIRCDFLIGTGRKWLRGPRGSGFLYAGDRALVATPDPLDSNTGWLDEHGEPVVAPGIRRFEPWELSWAAQLGLAAGARYLADLGPEAVYDGIAARSEYLRSALATAPGVTVHDRGLASGGIVSFSHDSVAASKIVTAARAAGINVGVVAATAAPFDGPVRALPPMVRASPHVYNDETELDSLLRVVSGL